MPSSRRSSLTAPSEDMSLSSTTDDHSTDDDRAFQYRLNGSLPGTLAAGPAIHAKSTSDIPSEGPQPVTATPSRRGHQHTTSQSTIRLDDSVDPDVDAADQQAADSTDDAHDSTAHDSASTASLSATKSTTTPSPLIASSSAPAVPTVAALTTAAPAGKRGNMIVETETVSALPSLVVSTVGASGASSLKVKKSTDNVTRTANRSKKKKASRTGQSSKAEIFAARVASAMDEVDSSDSDETFVYESNPPDHVAVTRPRFQSRNPSSSSLPFVNPPLNNQSSSSVLAADGTGHAPNGTPATVSTTSAPATMPAAVPARQQPSQQSQQTPQQQTPLQKPRNPAGPTDSSANSVNSHSLHSSHSIPVLPEPRDKDFLVVKREDRARSLRKHSTQLRSPSLYQSTTSSPSRPTSPKGDDTSVSPRLPPHSSLLVKNSRYHDSSGSARGRDATVRRWRSAGGSYMTEDDDDDYDEEAHGDLDDEEEYFNVSETTPLRAPAKGIRRVRKNGPLAAYSPHNYHHGKPEHFYYVRVMFWAVFLAVTVLCAGFALGFLLATNKPLQDVRVSQLFDILVSDDLLAFELVVEASNPGYLSVNVQNVDLDLLAKSPYVADSHAKGQDSDDEAHTMLLGNVHEFDVPLLFEGGIFSHHRQKSVADVRLLNPGVNSSDITIAEGKKKKPTGDEDEQEKWSRVNVHPFDLIVRGTLKYNLLFGRKRSATIAKTVRVDPSALLESDLEWKDIEDIE